MAGIPGKAGKIKKNMIGRPEMVPDHVEIVAGRLDDGFLDLYVHFCSPKQLISFFHRYENKLPGYEKGYSKEDIRVLLKFIDWLINLPEGLNKQLSKKIEKLEEDYKMPYITSWERIAKKEGKKEGKEEGKKEEKLETAKRMLLDDISIEMVMKYTGLTEKEVKALMN